MAAVKQINARNKNFTIETGVGDGGQPLRHQLHQCLQCFQNKLNLNDHHCQAGPDDAEDRHKKVVILFKFWIFYAHSMEEFYVCFTIWRHYIDYSIPFGVE